MATNRPDPSEFLKLAQRRLRELFGLAVLDAVQAHPHVDTETLIGAAGARLGAVSPGCVRRAVRPDR
jgi:hypothetical protein